jgi:hypothetical protein
MAPIKPRKPAAIFLVCLALAASPAGRRPGIGSVSGEGRAVYILKTKEVTIPSYEASGFHQKASLAGGDWRVEVSVDLAPLRVRAPFRFREKKLPGFLREPAVGRLTGALRGCQRQVEAVESVLLVLRDLTSYAERPQFSEEPAQVSLRREASCVGLTRLSAEILRSQGIRCSEVLGLKVPAGPGARVLEGGVLHAWLEVDFGEEGRAFYDPWRSCGWVGESCVVLRVGDGLDPGEFSALLGGTVEVQMREDRVFFEPAPGVSNILWRRPEMASFTGTLLTGKVLGPCEEPLTGKALLKGQGGEAVMDLWEGNFFFRDLEPGTYTLSIDAPGVSPEGASVTLGPMDKRRFLVYSRDGRERRKDGAGRQP